jgi:DNA-binding NarL/FixJ family response regulator
MRIKRRLGLNITQPCAAIIKSGTLDGSYGTLAIVAERRLSVAAIAALLLTDPDRSLAQAARGVDEVRAALEWSAPQVIIVEALGLDWGRLLGGAAESAATLLLLDPEDEAGSFVRAVRLGAQGYLSRTASREALLAAIERVAGEGYYLDPVLAARIFQASESAALTTSQPTLSQRESAILARIAGGRSSKEIAAEYGVTAKTVCNHVSNIYAKLNIRHRGQLVLYAFEQGLTSLEGTASA